MMKSVGVLGDLKEVYMVLLLGLIFVNDFDVFVKWYEELKY